ncbi:patatin-like phospholipase family protein [Nocardioides panaciterrulae]|uniref:NTE family protein n=1 Tax=Nocardioides panaciterrulae TaxID=661492 RepID=A0A7Y9E6R0_9ACTN|nr:patatin-like phospholipase family protein [Nocardioides panaciterrulae]NYD41975.1 NTE family protein [Nocardioides panaciterrulae]
MSTRRNIFILSGGGSRGAGQVGMLRGLWDAGIVPDMLIGGSVGAINACFMAAHPGERGIADLEDVWCGMSEEALCGRRHSVVVNVFRRRPYLFSADRLRRLVSEWVPTYHLENLPTPVRVATTDITTGRAVHHDHGYIPDLIAASAALPGIFPPVLLRGEDGLSTHVDAGVAENVPLSGAVEVARPGDRVWVLDVTRRPTTMRNLRNPLDVLIASLAASVRNRDEPSLPEGVEVVRCKLDETFDCGPVFDFGHTADLFRLGAQAAAEALASSAEVVAA